MKKTSCAFVPGKPDDSVLLQNHIPFILGATGTGLDIIDAQFNLRYVDPVWAQKYGDYHGRKCFDFFMGRKEPCTGCVLSEVLRTKKAQVSEEILISEGNRPVQVTSYPFQDENGDWLVAEVNVDISERKLAEEALRKSEEYLSAILRSIGDGVISTDAAGRVTNLNKVAENLTGWSAAESVGQMLEKVFRIVDAKTRAPVENPVERTLSEGVIVGLANHTLLIARDGTEYQIADSCAPVCDASGNIIGAVLVFRDQTQEYEAQRTLEKRFEMESFVARFSARCINLSAQKTDVSITEALESIGRLTGSDGAYLFLMDENQENMNFTHEWRAPGFASQMELIKSLSCESIPWVMAKLLRFEYVEIIDSADMPPDAVMEKKMLGSLHVKSILMVPIVLEQRLAGFVGFESAETGRNWSKEDRWILETMANIFSFVLDRRETEQELRKSEKWHRLLFESSRDALMTIGPPEFKFATVNSATLQMFGAKEVSELTALGPWDISPEKQPDGMLSIEKAKKMIEIAVCEGSCCFEWTHRRLNGKTFSSFVTISRIEADERSVFLASVRDITEQKMAEARLLDNQQALENANARLQQNQAQLMQSEKMASVGQLAAGVAHEINNPVGFISSNLNTLADYALTFKQLAEFVSALLKAPDTGSEAYSEALRRITELWEREDLDYILQDVESLVAESADGARRVKEIVQSLKSFSRVDEAVVKDADINDCLETTLKVVWNELKYKCEVRREYGYLPPLRCYVGQLNQVFMNLLVNAAHAIQDKGVITIRTDSDDKEIRVSVCDTGTGIAPEHIGHLFDPFFTTKPVGKGTGLGLSVSYNIVQTHNGRIEVTGTPGKGSVFTVHLPLEGVPGL